MMSRTTNTKAPRAPRSRSGAERIRPPTRSDLAGAKVLVLGLGRAGTRVAGFLLRVGAEVSGFDENPAVLKTGVVQRLRQAGMIAARRPQTAKADWVIVSPGISEENELVRSLRARGLVVVDELDFASQLVKAPIIAVTGTNGKSTVTALIGEMLKAAGNRVFVGGNLAPGRPLSAALSGGLQDFYVVEVSSFQLERALWFAPDVAVILNLAPDHLNRHRSTTRYAECKFRILDRQSELGYAVLNGDDPVVMKAKDRGRAGKQFFSMRRRVRGAYRRDGKLWFEGRPVAAERQMKLRGKHNVANALAAICASRLVGAAPKALRKALAGFTGLPHRLETVRRKDGVEYVNNSMCTNPAAGVASLRAFAHKVVLIAGGREKGLPVDDYAGEMAKRAKYVILLGESARKLGRRLGRAGFARFELCDDLKSAVVRARAVAGPGDVVLFSPGFASFDRFADFQARGEAFRKEVARLA